MEKCFYTSFCFELQKLESDSRIKTAALLKAVEFEGRTLLWTAGFDMTQRSYKKAFALQDDPYDKENKFSQNTKFALKVSQKSSEDDR